MDGERTGGAFAQHDLHAGNSAVGLGSRRFPFSGSSAPDELSPVAPLPPTMTTMTDITTTPSDRLERTMLYVPASRPNMIEKAAASEADAVCIDLEDAVAVDEKPASRANVVRAFRELDFGRKLKA